jgi:hypothetical protein
VSVDVEAVLTAAYSRSVGVEQGSVEGLVEQLRDAVVAAEVTAEALTARRAALRRVEARCIVSRVQAAFLDRVLV